MDSDTMNANSYLVPGEALGKVKNVNKKKKVKKSLEKRPQDDFLNKLTSLVVPDQQNESDDNDDLENARETSTESVAARDIVETVLQRRTKKSKRNQAADNDSNNETSSWAVTDQIGETDDMNIARIIDENASYSNNDEEKSTDAQGTEENDTNVPEKSIQSNQLDQSNEADQRNLSNQANDSSELAEPNASDNVNTNAVDDDHIFDREIAWNDEMRRFYNDSWGGETFSLRNIRARMPSKCPTKITFNRVISINASINDFKLLFSFSLSFSLGHAIRGFSQLDDIESR